MTIPDQPSALSKEELEGLLGEGAKRAENDRGTNASAAGTREDTSAPESLSQTAAALEGGVPDKNDAASTERAEVPAAAEEQVGDLRMVLDHWERTVAGLQQELIELRSRVSRLEQRLGEDSDEPLRLKTPDKPAADAEIVGMGEEPSALSRVRTYRSKRGWF